MDLKIKSDQTYMKVLNFFFCYSLLCKSLRLPNENKTLLVISIFCCSVNFFGEIFVCKRSLTTASAPHRDLISSSLKGKFTQKKNSVFIYSPSSSSKPVCISLFCWTHRNIFWRMSGAPLTSIVFVFPTMEVNVAPKLPGYKRSSKYLPLCSAEQRNSYRFGTTWGWVNDDRT